MDIQHKPYYEFKYLIRHSQLTQVLQLLEALLGGSDPYPKGIVDSIYFDSVDGYCLRQCSQGSYFKTKYRIRGYGEDRFTQVHLKEKRLSSTSKDKRSIASMNCHGSIGPDWHAIAAVGEADQVFHRIKASPVPLIPALRVTYQRHRYRYEDSRITLDSHVTVSSFINGWQVRKMKTQLMDHVLEIKTERPDPVLPLLGIVRLPPVSFSKFYLGAKALGAI